MTVQEFQKQIRSGDIDRVIILYGEEVAVMDEYLSHLYKAVKVRAHAPGQGQRRIPAPCTAQNDSGLSRDSRAR